MTDIAALNGLFKEVYADKIEKLELDNAFLTKLIPFVNRGSQSGNLYHVPVVLANAQGATYTGTAGSIVTLNASVAMTMKDAQVNTSSMVYRAELAYDAMARSETSKSAFIDATQLVVDNLLESHLTRLEIALMYGGSGLGKVASSTNVDTTNTTVTITAATHAPLIWSGVEGAVVNFYNGSTLISSGANANFTLGTISVDNRTMVVTGTTTGITALDSAISSAPNTLDVYFLGAKGNEPSGIEAIADNTGTLFNISASTYNRWKVVTDTVSGSPTMAKVLSTVGKLASRGKPGDLDLIAHPVTWGNLNSDLSANRRYDGSFSVEKLSNGTKEIVYYSQTGAIKVHSWAGCKAGQMYLLPRKHMERPGASEVTFNVPGKTDEFFTDDVNKNCFVLKTYSNQSILCRQPCLMAKITGFTNS